MKARRKFTGEYKAKVVLEMAPKRATLLSGERSVADIVHKEGIPKGTFGKDTLLHEWRSEFIRNAPQVFGALQAQAEQEQSNRAAELEQMIGRLTMAQPLAQPLAPRWPLGGPLRVA